VQDVKASILNRSDRKFWYVKYQVIFENKTVTKEKSTKVYKTERTLKYMETKYLPAWLAQKKEELKLTQQSSTTFSHYASIYLIEKRNLHNFPNIQYYTNRILADFGIVDIRQITKLQVKQWIHSLIDKRTNEGLSKNSKGKYLGVFHSVFELAKDDNVLETNFTYDIKLAGEKRNLNDIRPFSAHEVNILLESSKVVKYGELLHSYLGIAFNQGMSPAEIIGLQIGDINLKDQTITIKRNITKGKVKETKTIFRNRTIPIFDTTMPYIANLLSIAHSKKSIWLLSRGDGTHLIDIKDIRGTRSLIKIEKGMKKKVKYDTKWYKLLNDLNIEYRDIKNCRHTFAVSSIESKDFTMQEIASLLGHGSLKMLIEVYAKWIGDKALKVDKKINLYGDTLGDTDNNSNLYSF